jgi:integrase
MSTTTHGDAKGIYQQAGKLTYWLRFSRGGVQHRVSLGTRDYAEAIAKAREIRAGSAKDTRVASKVWSKAVADYLEEKLAENSFRPDTAAKVKSCLTVFARETGVGSPAEVTKEILQGYYDARRRKSEAGARSTIAQIQAFLGHLDCLPGRVKRPKGSKPERREVTISMSTVNEMLERASDQRLRFAVFCAGHAGMRAGEIKRAQVSWFDLRRKIIAVPAWASLEIKGKKTDWQPKDSESREIPISAPFLSFLEGYLAGKEGRVLVGRKGSLYDFRLPLSKLAAAVGHPELFPHAFRHSWISELCNSGNHTIQEVASWSGDCIATIEANYWHKRAEPGALDKTVAGVRASEETARQLAEILAAAQGAQVLHSSTY